MAEKELSSEEVESFRKELAEIKADMMRKELEEIKKERMRQELEELKRERAPATAAAPQQPHYAGPRGPSRPSSVNVALAALMLLAAGYLVGTLYLVDSAGAIDGYLGSLSLPAFGALIVAALALALAAIGAALITIARR